MQQSPERNVRLIRVHTGSRGVTRHLLTEALSCRQWPDYSDILYIGPTSAKTREAQRICHSLARHPYIPPRFQTLKQTAMDVFSIDMPARQLPAQLVPLILSELSGQRIGYSRMLANLMKELKQHRPGDDFTGIGEDMDAIFVRLGIPEDSREKLLASLEVFGRYQEALAASGLCDDDDIIRMAPGAIERHGIAYRVVMVDGFSDMTPAEGNLLTAIARQAELTIATLPTAAADGTAIDGYLTRLQRSCSVAETTIESSAANATIVRYAGIEEEVEGVVRHIKNLHVIGRLKEDDSIVVAFPDLSSYRELCERVCRRYGVPHTFAARKPPSSRPPMRDFFHLLNAAADDYPRVAFTAFLNSPYFRNIDDVLRLRIPALSLRSGIIKGRQSWEACPDAMDDRTLAAVIRNSLSDVFGRIERLEGLRDGAGPAVFATVIPTVLDALGFENADDARTEIEGAMELLQGIQFIPGMRQITLRRYTECLQHLLGVSAYQREEALVQFIDFRDTRGLEPRRLYLCGLKEGDLPSKPPVDLLLPESVRSEYGLTNLKSHLRLQRLDFERLVGSAEEVHLSYPGMDGDTVFLPSPFLPWQAETDEKVYGIFSRAELQTREGGDSLAGTMDEIRLSGRSLERISAKEIAMPLRVTDIDAFRKCPRRFFIERVLRLEASEVREFDVEVRLLGTVIHRVMEELMRAASPGSPAFTEQAARILDSVLSEFPIDAYWKKLLRESFLAMLPAITDVEEELREEGFMPDSFEMKVEEELLPGVRLKGKVDRIDRREAVFRVIDYKTGSASVGSEIATKGKDLQLPLYAAMLKAGGMTVEKAGIYSLRDVGIKWIPTKRDSRTLDDYIDAALAYLGGTVETLRRGDFTAAPLEDFYCGTCAESPFCPYIHARGGSERG